MRQWVRQWLGTNPESARPQPEEVRSVAQPTAVQSVMQPAPIPQLGPKHDGEPVPYYPRKGPAVPAVPPHKILATQQKLIRELRQASALSFTEFDTYILPAIERFAEFVHLLPASEYDHHSDLGGLFRHGLEVALNASRRAEGKEFALNETPSVRKFQIFRWRACALLGGMLHDLGKAVIDVGASDVTGTRIWNPHVQSLWGWLEELGIEHYTISWRETRRHREHDAISATALLRIIPDATMRWMDEHRGKVAYDAMLMALTGSSDRNNPLIDIIKGADGDSVRVDRAESQKRLASIGEAGSRSSAALLVRAMRERILQGEWPVNQLGSPVWYTTQGIYVMHPIAAKQAVEHLRNQELTTIPNDPSLVLAILREAGVIAPMSLPDGGSYDLHRIHIHATDRDQPVKLDLTAMKFVGDRIVPDYFVLPTPLEVDLCDPDGLVLSFVPVRRFVAEPADAPVAAAATGGDTLPAESGASAAAESASARERPAPERGRPKTRKTPPDKAAPRQAPASESAPAGATAEATAPAAPSHFVDDDVPYLPPALDHDALLGDDETLDAVIFGGDPVLPRDGANEPLRDWGAERDHRDALIAEELEINRDPFPPRTREGADKWLEQELHGIYLRFLLDRVRSGLLHWDQDIWEIEDQLAFRYPESIEGCGMEPSSALDVLAEQGWLETDPANEMRKTFPMPHGKEVVSTIRFTHGVSAALRLLMPPRKLERAKVPDAGPHITGDRAEVLNAFGMSHPSGRAVVRLAFHDFLNEEYKDVEGGFSSAMNVDLAGLIRQFNKAHFRGPIIGLRTALSVGENPIARLEGREDMYYIAEYQRGLDEIALRKALDAFEG